MYVSLAKCPDSNSPRVGWMYKSFISRKSVLYFMQPTLKGKDLKSVPENSMSLLVVWVSAYKSHSSNVLSVYVIHQCLLMTTGDTSTGYSIGRQIMHSYTAFPNYIP